MVNSDNIYNNKVQSRLNPETHYGLKKTECGGAFGVYPPNTIGEAVYDNSLQNEAIRNNMNNGSNINKSNDNPSLRQADIAYSEGGTTTGDYIENDSSNFTGNNYLGDLQQIKSVKNIDMMDDYSPQYAQTPANSFNYGATITDPLREALGIDIADYPMQQPVTAKSIQYHNGFLRSQVGRRITVDFLVGSNQIVSKTGYLLGVAQDYILINELDTNDITSCDFYNIKFMRFYY